MLRHRYFMALKKRKEVSNNWAEPFVTRIAFLIARKDVGILNDKLSVPQCSSLQVSDHHITSSQWQDTVYQVALRKGSGSVCVGPNFQTVCL